jgi:biopolymer transport protein ExbD
MAVKIKKSSALDALNITPLIDIVFLLLIFFLVTSRFEAEEQALEIEPPQASEAVPLTAQPQQLTISIDTAGKYYVGGAVLDAKGLERKLIQERSEHAESRPVRIRADRKAQFQSVATAMNLCKKYGFRDIHVAMDND